MTETLKSTPRGSVAIVAAHPDDEVLGCGGTAARFAAEGSAVHALLVAEGEGARAEEGTAIQARMAARAAAARAAGTILGLSSVELLGLPDNRLDSLHLLDVVRPIEQFITRHRPRVLMTHHWGDVNLDHRIVHEAVIVACRPQPGHCVQELLFFETLSSTEWRPAGSARSFEPNWFVDVSATLELKLKALEAYASELRQFPHPRSSAAARALAAFRGASAGFEAAEAFVLGRKLHARREPS